MSYSYGPELTVLLTKHNTQKIQFPEGFFFFSFFSLCPKMVEVKNNRGVLFAFVRGALSFWANLKLQTNIFSVNWQNESKRSAG